MQLYNFAILQLQGADQEDLGLHLPAGAGEGQAGLCRRNFWQWGLAEQGGVQGGVPDHVEVVVKVVVKIMLKLVVMVKFKRWKERPRPMGIFCRWNCFAIKIQTLFITGWLWGGLSQACLQVHERFPLVVIFSKDGKIERSICQVKDCVPLNTLAGEDRRRHGNQHLPHLETLADSRHDMINYCIIGEQHVVPLRTSDKHGAQERDFHDRLLFKERSCSQTWWVAWGTWKVAGASICSPFIYKDHKQSLLWVIELTRSHMKSILRRCTLPIAMELSIFSVPVSEISSFRCFFLL